jgi:putative ABC transport system permease protein
VPLTVNEEVIPMQTLFQDLRYGARMLRKKPGFTVIAIATLALGIGANTAIFSVAYAVLLGPLPYERPEQLALIWSSFQKMGASRAPASAVEMREIRDHSELLQDLAGIWVGNGTLTGDQEPEQIKLASVTDNFFSVLGAQPVLGRTFAPEDQSTQGTRAMILSYGLWQRRFGKDPDVIGRQIRLGSGSATVVGVMPQKFQLLFSPDANVPLDTQAFVPFSSRIYQAPVDLYYIRLVARLKPGVTLAQAQQEADSIAGQLRGRFPAFATENLRLEMVPMRGDAVRDLRTVLLALVIGAGLVMLIACANIANLLLSQANARHQEFAVRSALGASPWRLMRQVMSESFLLCFLGGVAGLYLGWDGVRLLLSMRPDGLARIGSVDLNWPVLGYVAGISVLSGILFGLAPALESRKANLIEALKGAGRSATARGLRRTRAMLVVSEVALGFMLLVGAGLMFRTLAQLHKVDPGFNADGVLTFEISMAGRDFASAGQRASFVTQWEEKLSALPGVEAVGAVSHLPLDDYPNWYSPYSPEGLTDEQKQNLLADYRCVTPGYFKAMGAKLVAGRWFDKHDNESGRGVVVVDDLLARQTWPAENAIGKKIEAEHYTDNGFITQWAEVVGVVEHLRHHSLSKELRGQVYLPYPQSAREHLSYAIRSKGDLLGLAEPIRRELRAINKEMALNKVRPMQQYVDKDLASAGFTTMLAGLFGAVALLLAAVGIYGVISYSVNQRTREIGIRVALGARATDVLRLIVGQGIALALIGVGAGVVFALVLTRLMSSLLFEVSATDPLTFAAIAVLLTAVALAACLVPARRATKVDPVVALRHE